MKRLIRNGLVIASCTALLLSGSAVYATEESGSSEETTEAVETEDSGITFRGIEWYSTKADVEQTLFADGAKEAGSLGVADKIYRMSGTNFSSVTLGTDRVDGGGYRGWYSGISVAGYTPSDTYACYVYSIDDSGAIDRNGDTAQFYFGWYTFDANDFSDHEGIYDDLAAKLSSLYGDCEDFAGDYWTTKTWTDDSGNQIRLLINSDKNYVTLGYMASDADARLDAMQEALDNEQAVAEESERQENASNTDGL